MNTNTKLGTRGGAAAQFLTRSELAIRWKCSAETVKRRETSGMLHPVRLGARKLLYRLADIEAIECGHGGHAGGICFNEGGAQ